MSSPILARVEAHVFRTPIKEPVRTSFGTMTERAAVFVRVEDSDGARGRSLDDPVALWSEIDRALHVLRVQSGDAGAFSAAAAGLDLAIHDLRARKRGLPLWRALGGRDESPVPVYASGINPGRDALKTVERMRAIGHRAFKLKIGFGEPTDLASLRPVAQSLATGERLMVDVNQGWDLRTAMTMLPRLAAFPLAWIEEPL